MANNPSPKSQYNRGHVRKPTPILPALPLSLSDKAWRRSIEIAPIAEEESSGPIAALPATERSHVESQDHHVQNGDADQQSDLRHEQDAVPTQNRNADEKDAASTAVEIKDDKSSSAEETTVNEQPLQPQTVENAHVTEQRPEDAPQVVSESDERVETDTEVSNLEPSAVAEVKKVQILDREGLPSDHDQSSVDPSSISAATDQSSITGESALETVVDDSSHLDRNPTLSHRKSEAAPEALANGFSPRSVHERNGSQPIVLPALPKPVPLPSIHEHLLSLASTKQFFDTVIYINHPDTSLQPSEHFSHSLFLCRSEIFAKILSEIDPSIHPKVINLYPSRNILSHAFEAALRFFYSDHVLTTQTLMPQAAYQTRQAKQYTFEYIMSYWVAGVELGLLPVKSRAHEMVQDLISWDIADAVAKEIHDLRYAEESLQNGQDKFEVREIANSLSRLLASRLFAQLDLVSIDLSNTAQSLSLPTRFSALEYPRSNNPALSSMVFGSLSSEQTNAPNPVSIMTSILTNISFLDLSIVVDEIGSIYGLPGENFVRQVIEIREANRDHVINNRSIPNKQRLSNSSVWEPAGHREYLDEYGRLSRERVGFLLPIRNR